ncbi:MAG: hypothetical protein ACK5KT_00755 [Dysgonomonas sp.]
MKMHHILSRVFKILFIKDVCIFSKEEAINVQFLLMLEDMKNSEKNKPNDYCEIGMNNCYSIHRGGGLSANPTAAKIMKNDYSLKVEFNGIEKIRMRILDDAGKPFYLRKLDPTVSHKEVLINISDWFSGDYNIELTNLLGTTIAFGKFEIC